MHVSISLLNIFLLNVCLVKKNASEELRGNITFNFSCEILLFGSKKQV